MKSIGIVRHVDDLGRIVIPIELRRAIGMHYGDAIEVFYDDEEKSVMVRKYRTVECLFCQSTDREKLSPFKERFICSDCLQEARKESGLPE